MWFDPRLEVKYRPRGSLQNLARQYFEYGSWKRVVLSQQDFAPIVPTIVTSDGASTSLVELYKRLFSEPDLGHLRSLQRAVFEYDKLGTEPKRRAVLDLLNELSPHGGWNDAHVGALDALLVRDITFKQISPFQVSGDGW